MPRKDQDDYNAYMREYMLKRYHERKAEAQSILGGVCVECGSNENLQFDHIDPTLKSFSVGKLWSVSKPKFLTEIAKCQLLCEDHHKIKTTEDWKSGRIKRVVKSP